MLRSEPSATGKGLEGNRRPGRVNQLMATRALKPRRILVVDDEPLVCDSIKRMLVFDGHDVDLATSGQQALVLFEKKKFDLIIIDYRMPEMRGDRLASLIRARVTDQRILMISATAQTLHPSDRELADVDAIIGKPFPLEELREAISSLLPSGESAA